MSHRLTITYCTQCRWMLRATWIAQELLSTFEADLTEVTLKPGTGGVYTIEIDGKILWDRKADNGFPQPKEIKQRLRDTIDPDRDLGHSDR